MEALVPQTKLEWMTPKRAQDILVSCNTNNRDVRSDHVNFLASLIESGRWFITHQGIAFDKNGRLVDGQHRLMAIVKSNMRVPILVTNNLEEESYNYIDIGNKRNQCDIYKIKKSLSAFITSLTKPYLTGNVRKWNDKQIKNIIKKTAPIHETLVGNAVVKTFTSGPSLVALFYHYSRQENFRPYIKDFFTNLRLYNYSDLPPIGQAYHKHISKFTNMTMNPHKVLMDLLFVYDPKNQMEEKIKKVKSDVYSDFLIWIDELVKE